MTFDRFVQIAGVIDQAEADLLIECGVRHLGFPLRLPVHAEDLTEYDAARIIAGLPPRVYGVLITYLARAADIAGFCRTLGTSVVQLHGDIAADELARLRDDAPDITVIKSLVVRARGTTDNLADLERTAAALAPWTDAFITDTFDPATGASGATGKTHDHRISRRLVEVSPRPVILAGGLTPDNVAAAIHAVRPAGVDTHTGVEGPDGRKDRDRVRDFMRAARGAFDEIAGL